MGVPASFEGSLVVILKDILLLLLLLLLLINCDFNTFLQFFEVGTSTTKFGK
jgi:uncharacterized integral membrane protein